MSSLLSPYRLIHILFIWLACSLILHWVAWWFSWTRDCPPILHLTVIISSELADLLWFSFVRSFSPFADVGVASCSMGPIAFCFSTGHVAASTALNCSNRDVCISKLLGTFTSADVDVLGGQKIISVVWNHYHCLQVIFLWNNDSWVQMVCFFLLFFWVDQVLYWRVSHLCLLFKMFAG